MAGTIKIAEMKQFQDKTVVLHLKDGEILKAKVEFVDHEYEDLIVDVFETNRPKNYPDHDASYTIPVSDIEMVVLAD